MVREERREAEEIYGKKSFLRRSPFYTGVANVVAVVWKHTFAKIGEDWGKLPAIHCDQIFSIVIVYRGLYN